MENKMIIECPHCGAKIEYDANAASCTCEYCSSTIQLTPGAGAVNTNMQSQANPQNLKLPAQPYGAPQVNPYGYNPAAMQKAKSEKNKKAAIIALAIGVFLILLLIVTGLFYAAYRFEKDLPDQSAVTKEEPADAEAKEQAEADEYVLMEIPELQVIEEPDMEDFVVEDPYEDVKVNPAAELPEDDPNNMFTVQIGNELYHVPSSVAYFLDKGWTFEDDSIANQSLGYLDTEYLSLYYNGDSQKFLSVHVTNFDVNSQAMKDCYVTQMSLSDFQAEKYGVDIKTHSGDIVLTKSTKEDLINVLGEPNVDSIGSRGDMVTYCKYDEGEGYSYGPDITYYFNEDGILNMIAIENEEEPEGFAITDVSDEVPEYLSTYEAPTELGDDPFSGNFLVDGKVYRLPLPFSELVKNGWEYDGDPDYIAGAQQEYVVQFHKGDLTLTGRTFNPSDKATYIKYTMITCIGARSGSISHNDIEFPGGLSGAMSQEEVVAYLEKNNIKNYKYHEDLSYNIPLDQTGEDRVRRNDRYTIYLSDG
jgi:hypothetical protein